MVRMFARHQVADYDAWRKVYDSFERETLGVRQNAVYRTVADPNPLSRTLPARLASRPAW